MGPGHIKQVTNDGPAATDGWNVGIASAVFGQRFHKLYQHQGNEDGYQDEGQHLASFDLESEEGKYLDQRLYTIGKRHQLKEKIFKNVIVGSFLLAYFP